MSAKKYRTTPCILFGLLFGLAQLSPCNTLARSLRTVEADEGSVTLIKTALGYSTILEFQSRPMSAVLGDQDSFRLEYVGNSITIKPLSTHARSNLFIFTEHGRFNCQLLTVAPSQVDYLVRVHAKVKTYPVETGASVQGGVGNRAAWLITQVHRSASYDGFTLNISAVSRERGSPRPRQVTLVDFELSSLKNPYRFQAGALGIKQSQRFVSIESLSLGQTELLPGAPPIRGRFALLAKDFDSSLPMSVVFAVPGVLPHARSYPPANRLQGHRLEVKVHPRTSTRQTATASSTLVGGASPRETGKPHEKGK